jgi:2-haloacid dehalogenase
MPPVVTFDLFSALLDSRTGGSAVFSVWARERGWPAAPGEVYDRWDAHNKDAQRRCRDWVPYTDLARDALRRAYAELGLDGDAGADADHLVASVDRWPPWPDVVAGLGALAGSVTVGILSNVDDDIVARTQVAALVSPEHTLTSQRLGVYKPDPRIYHRAVEAFPGMVHVATSARDVRGSLEAGIPVVRLRRPGHHLDPAGPAPDHEATSVPAVHEVLRRR